MLSNKIKKQIKRHKIISFDIFDTALLRPYVSPDDVFFHMEKLFKAPGFALSRKKAEQIAWDSERTEDKEDTCLSEIYKYIDKKFKLLEKEEISFEMDILVPNPEIYALYKYALSKNKQVIFVSDMYLPAEMLATALHKNGYNKYTHLYVSCEYGKLKNTGNLYRKVLADFNIQPNEILHIGDNEHSDVKMASEIGISSIYYPKILKRYIDNNPRVLNFINNHPHNVGASIICMLSAMHWNASRRSYWNDFGYEYCGPACLSFMKWFEQHLGKNKDIIFVARDGYTLEKVFNMFGHKDIKTHYIYAPRALNLLCQLNYEREGKFAYEHTKTLIEYYRKKSSLLSDAPTIKSGEEGVAYIDAHIDTFKLLAKAEKRNYINYLKSHNIESNKVALVDTVSMYYSAQRFLASLMTDKEINGYYYQIQTGAKFSNNVFSFRPKDYYSPDLLLIEFMMTAPEAPIEAIANNKPLYKSPIKKQERKRQKSYISISAGALLFSSDIIRIFKQKDVFIDDQTLTDWIMAFIQAPTELDKRHFFDIQYAYDPQHSQYNPIFKEWYNKAEPTSKKISSTKISILGVPFKIKKYIEKKEYCALNIPILTRKEAKSLIRWYLFGFVPFIKIKKKG